ncbi:hypothetical protein J4457_04915 [Candidatus Woesearchaeota archaeon]|nr:hypothetical protein [Candidatus Woesearchaeota archaeon]
MKKIIFVTILMLLILLLAGCTFFGGKQQVPDVNVHIGREGLTIRFLKDTPPKSVYEDTNFPLLVEIQNKGAADIEAGWLIIGYEQANVEISGETVQPFRLLGRTSADQIGGQEIIDLVGHAKKLSSQMQRVDSTLSVTACYAYTTDATTDVCIETDIYGLAKYQKSCKVETKAMSGGQGAPVGVTKVEPKMIPHENRDKVIPEFTIEIQNLGSGQSLVPEMIDTACSSRSIKHEAFNIVRVEAKLYEYDLDCRPKIGDVITENIPQGIANAGYVKLKEKKGTVICSLPSGISKARGTYLSPLRVHLDYGYMDTIAKQMEIKRPAS